MKTTTPTILIIIFLFPLLLFSQNNVSQLISGSGQYPRVTNDAEHPCITKEQYKNIEKELAASIKLLTIKNNSKAAEMATTFSWPLTMANGLNDCSYYYISAYVDHDTASPGYKDWNCGTVTYDGHRGTDICSSPYPFYKMDNNQLEVIAAAPGTIVNKVDGNFDKNCAINNLTANYIIIEHSDGSVALYWHMKMNSLTSKVVGQTVVAGEYLGVVGSSGDASGPHLHFEVWSGTTANTLTDPYAGTCNTLNANTLWASQKPYSEPAIVKQQVNTIAPVFPACPATETPNEDSCFSGGAAAKFYIFIRNETSGLTANMRILNPNGTTYSSWSHNSTNNYVSVSYYFTNRTLPSTSGTYTFESVYNGDTCRKYFKINCSSVGIQENKTAAASSIYPVPLITSATVLMDNALTNATLELYNSLGQKVKKVNNISGTTFKLDRDNLPAGLYFICITEDNRELIRNKLIIIDN